MAPLYFADEGPAILVDRELLDFLVDYNNFLTGSKNESGVAIPPNYFSSTRNYLLVHLTQYVQRNIALLNNKSQMASQLKKLLNTTHDNVSCFRASKINVKDPLKTLQKNRQLLSVLRFHS